MSTTAVIHHPRRLPRLWIGAAALGALLVALVALAALGPPTDAPYSPTPTGDGRRELTGVPFGGTVWGQNARNGLPVVYTDDMDGVWQTIQVDDPTASGAMISFPRRSPPVPIMILAIAGVLLAGALVLRAFSPGLGWLFLLGAISVSSLALVGRYPEPLSALVWLTPLPVGFGTLTEARPRQRIAAVFAMTAVGVGLALLAFLAERPGGNAPSILALGPVAAGGIALTSALSLHLRDALARARGQSAERLDLSAVINELVPGYSATRLAAAERERGKLALEIHDDVLPALTAVTRRLEEISPTEAEDLRRVAATLRAQMAERRLVTLEALGLAPALRELVERLDREVRTDAVRLALEDERAHGPEVVPGAAGWTRLPEAIELAAYRIAQQALVNALEHAAGATQIAVRLENNGHGARVGLALAVRDDGHGLAPSALESAIREGHLGFADMRARAAAVGGRLDIGPAQAGEPRGMEVRFQWPA